MRAIEMQYDSPFYVTGGTLARDALCYVTRRADHQLYQDIREGRFCYVLTARQMGKSSLMVRTASRLRDEGFGVAVLDLTAIGQNLSAEQWYGGLLTQMAQQLNLEDELEEFWEGHAGLGPLQRWMQAIRQAVLPRYPGRVVVFIDEIDAVRSLPFSTDEFFAGIREFYNHRTEDVELERLSFCLLGVAAPSDLIRDTRMTPFNIGERIELHDFTEGEAQVLGVGLGKGERAGGAKLGRILYWTGGHPYLTQRLCQAVAEQGSGGSVEEVDRLCGELYFARRAREQDDNLLFVRERMLRSEVELAGLLSLYEQVYRGKRVEDDETNPLISVLRLSGIVRAEVGVLKVRNRIYERVFNPEWIAQNMPDAEVKRQRAAYRKGLLLAAAIAAVIVAAIAGLAFVAISQRNIARAEAARADQNLQQANLSAEQALAALAEAERQRQRAEEQRIEAENQRRQAVTQQIIAEEQRDRAEQQENANRRLLYAAQMNLAGQAWEDAGIPRMVDLLNSQIPKPGQQDLRGFEWNYLWNLGNSDLRSFPHDNRVTSVSFFPDNRRLVTAGHDLMVRIWDIITGQQLMALSGHTDNIWSVAISPDGKTLASGSKDQTVKLWNTLTGLEVATLKGHTVGVAAIAFSPDGMKLATGSYDKSVKLWDVATAREVATLAHPDMLNWVAFSPDGKLLATACSDRNARLWDAISGKELHTLKGHIAPVSTLAFSPDGATLITGGGENDIRFWDVATGKAILVTTQTGNQQPGPKMIRSGGAVLSVSFSPGGETIAVASYDRTVKLYSATNLQLLKTFRGHGLSADRVAFSPNGKLLVSVGRDWVAKLWDPAVDQEAVFQPGDLQVNGLAFSPDGCCLATGGRSTIARLWNATTQEEMKAFRGHTDGILDVAYSPDGRFIVTASRDKTARLWDVASGKEVRSFKGHTGFLNCVVVSPDGKRLATGSDDRTARLWDVLSGKELATFSDHAASVVSLAFSPDSRRLATASVDGNGTVKIWDARTFREIATFNHIARVFYIAFSPDGRHLATACEDGLIRFWDLSTRKESLTLKGHHSPPNRLAFFPDGRRLATGSGDNTVKLWNLETRQEMLSVRHSFPIRALAVSSDGRKLASATSNQVKVWLTGDQATAARHKIERLRELSFERKTPERTAAPATPPGWTLHGGSPDRYETGVDHSIRHLGTASAFIRSIKPPPTAHISVYQGVRVDEFRGKRVRLSAYVKAERVSQYAGLWMRVDGVGYPINFDNMSSRPIRGTADWKKYEVVLDVPEESFSLWFGFNLIGEGQVWADDFEVEIVGPDVPSTGQAGFGDKYRDEFMRRPEEERRLTEQKIMTVVYNLPVKPVNLDIEGSK